MEKKKYLRRGRVVIGVKRVNGENDLGHRARRLLIRWRRSRGRSGGGVRLETFSDKRWAFHEPNSSLCSGRLQRPIGIVVVAALLLLLLLVFHVGATATGFFVYLLSF